MDAALLAMMDTAVSFKPRLPPGGEGQVNYGPETSPVLARIDWTQAQRNPNARGEPTEPNGTIFLNGPSFDPVSIPVGSLVVLPDGQEAAVNTVQSFADWDDSTVVDHWELGL